MRRHPGNPWRGRLSAFLCSRRGRCLCAAALCLAFVALPALDALARAGGGQSYSGGGSGGSSGGGGGGDGIGALIHLLVWLCIEFPIIGIPLTIGVVVMAGVAYARSSSGGNAAWSAGTGPGGGGAPEGIRGSSAAQQGRAAQLRNRFRQLRAGDPAFSRALFEDFAYFLYAELQRARAHDNPALAAYATPEVLGALRDRTLADVRGIIVGAMQVQGIHGIGGPRVAIDVRVESNVVEVSAEEPGRERRFYRVDRLRLMRDAGARSRPAARTQVLDCPNCGAPFDALRGTTCTYCNQQVGGGHFDWQVTIFTSDRRELRGPLLTEDVPEAGTDLPTLRAPDAQQNFAALIERDPALSWEAFADRVREVFAHLQAGWSERDEARIRPYITDNLFQSMVYWLDLYRAQRCRNLNEDSRILKMVLADVSSDETYDAVTVRVYATGLDYTLSDDGKVLCGSRTRPRDYSEYWTLIRGRACQGKPKGSGKCPNCGGPLKISMTGTCDYCQAKVTSGDFDWVLSRIEQDESYGG